MEIKKGETKTVRHAKVENGYIVTLETSKETAKGIEFKTKQYIAKTADETDKLLNELIK